MKADKRIPLEKYRGENSYTPIPVSSHLIYIALILLFIGTLFALPFLSIDVSVKSYGSIKSVAEQNILKAKASGLVKTVFVRENVHVKRGDLLYSVTSPILEEKEKYLKKRIIGIDEFLNDLKFLVNTNIESGTLKLSTPLYHQSLTDYHQNLTDHRIRFKKAEQDYDRNRKLFNEQVIAAVEFENFKFEMDKAWGELELLKHSQLSQWQRELKDYEKEHLDFLSQLEQVQIETEKLNITAPVSGALQNLAGIYPGSPLSADQVLGQISPDTSLMAIAYVQPKDIGLLRKGMNVRLQVDAFNYNQWGMATGKVMDVPQDVKIIENEPVFEVRCSLDNDFLTLKSGYKGFLKKGMSVRTRFIVTERSLWQLLYDQVDNWLNPNL